ncbi:MAG: response regulator, partial [Alphaproteobacteria bacterium]|nr:response regulator [Alphaproteobacteria bacterium]
MVKVLIVDDSALMRRQLGRILTEAGFEVVTARNGAEGLRLAAEAAPDVITLDVNMPEMDGLTMLSRLMVETPKPVVMVSSLTEQGALATFEALELGAVDYVHKPDGTVSHRIDDVQREIVEKVRAAARARIRRAHGVHGRMQVERARGAQPAPAKIAEPIGEAACVVLIGVSTGGPGTLEEILCELPAGFPAPILVAQHMPSNFTGVFARRLNDTCALEVQEVRVPTPLRPGNVYVGRGDADLLLSRRGAEVHAAAVPSSTGL